MSRIVGPWRRFALAEVKLIALGVNQILDSCFLPVWNMEVKHPQTLTTGQNVLW